jgi:hypothetical protein
MAGIVSLDEMGAFKKSKSRIERYLVGVFINSTKKGKASLIGSRWTEFQLYPSSLLIALHSSLRENSISTIFCRSIDNGIFSCCESKSS